VQELFTFVLEDPGVEMRQPLLGERERLAGRAGRQGFDELEGNRMEGEDFFWSLGLTWLQWVRHVNALLVSA
jgi:hypothetical protein